MFNDKGLTELESKVMQAARKTDYGDCLNDPVWSFSVCDAAGLDQKVYRGVVSSLVQKGFVTICDNEGKGKFNDMVFSFTRAGQARFRDE